MAAKSTQDTIAISKVLATSNVGHFVISSSDPELNLGVRELIRLTSESKVKWAIVNEDELYAARFGSTYISVLDNGECSLEVYYLTSDMTPPSYEFESIEATDIPEIKSLFDLVKSKAAHIQLHPVFDGIHDFFSLLVKNKGGSATARTGHLAVADTSYEDYDVTQILFSAIKATKEGALAWYKAGSVTYVAIGGSCRLRLYSYADSTALTAETLFPESSDNSLQTFEAHSSESEGVKSNLEELYSAVEAVAKPYADVRSKAPHDLADAIVRVIHGERK